MNNEDLLKKVSESLNLKDIEDELEDDLGGSTTLDEEVDETETELETEVDTEIEEDDDDDYSGTEITGIDNGAFEDHKPTKEEKERFAFAKLRKENKEKAEELARIEEIAKAYGFSDSKVMLEQLQKSAIEKKAKEQNMDPEVYRRIHETEKELEAIKKQREEELMHNRISAVNTKLDNFIRANNLKTEHKEKLIYALDEDGYSLDDLVRLKNPNNFFKMYLETELSESMTQKEIEKRERERKLQEKKFNDTDTPKEFTMDEIIKNMLKNNKNI